MQGYFLSADGRTVYFRSRDDQGPALFSVSIDGRDRQRLVAGTFPGLRPTADRRRVFYTETGELWQMEMTGQRRKTRVPFAVTVRVDERDEWAQILDESWRVMKYRFYDENMHGKDWTAIRAKYEPLLKYVGANEDVYDLANEMIGELNASHTGVSGPDSDPQPGGYQTRYLGFELVADARRLQGGATSTATARPTRSGSTSRSATTSRRSTARPSRPATTTGSSSTAR